MPRDARQLKLKADVVLIGAGPHGLAVLAALAARPEPWPARVVVIDPHDGWAHAWDEKLARLDLDRLRSPQVHHPGPRPMELRDLVEALPEDEQSELRRREDERVPTPAGMRALVDHLAEGLGPVEWVVGRAERIELVGGEQPRRDARVHLGTGRVIEARNVVVAHNPSYPRIPGWAEPVIGAGLAEHASAVDLRTEEVDGRHIAVVGGGLTAGSLAVAALCRGARVTLLTRRPLRARPYDVDASWLGPNRLNEFRAATPEERRRLIDEARDGGTMPPRVLEELRELASTPDAGLVILETVDVEAELAALLAEAGHLSDAAGPLIDAPLPDTLIHPDDDAPQHHTAAAISGIWLATGFENDVLRDPLVGPLVAAEGVAVHGGLPEVSDELRLGETPVFVAGPYAALAVGPASRNLAGSRTAASGIACAFAWAQHRPQP